MGLLYISQRDDDASSQLLSCPTARHAELTPPRLRILHRLRRQRCPRGAVPSHPQRTSRVHRVLDGETDQLADTRRMHHR